jgi:hypothetical protein
LQSKRASPRPPTRGVDEPFFQFFQTMILYGYS